MTATANAPAPAGGATLGAVVLAGGLARRMGGIDKGLVPLGGQPMVAHVLAAVAPGVDALLVNANRNAEAYGALAAVHGGTVIADRHAGHLGPLAGLAAGIAALGTTRVALCPCDSPFIDPALLPRLAAVCAEPDVDVAVAHDGARMQPVFCVVEADALASLEAFLAAGERKIDRWFAALRTRTVDCSDLAISFRNVNTEEERVAAERELGIVRQPSCEDEREPALLPVEEARRRIAAAIVPLGEHETVALGEASGRVLAAGVRAPHDVPAGDNSAMDGYAIAATSIPGRGEATLAVIGTAWAGRPFAGSVGAGEAVRIFTGALMPVGADTVVIQERVAREGERAVRIDADVESGRNVRAAGEDIGAGQEVLGAGRRLEAADIGVIASLGIGRVTLTRRPRVAFFTTGDELVALAPDDDGAAPPPGMLYDSNRHTLAALLGALRVDTIDLGIVPDEPAATREALLSAASRSDLVVTSGGISAGDADFVTRAFHACGDVAFWKIAMRPGRPLAFGHLDAGGGSGAVDGRRAAFFGLPGNPVAVVVTFLQFVQPAIRRLAGERDVAPLTLPARCLSRLRKPPGRVEYQRGVMRVEGGELVVASTGAQGAGRLSSVSAANCLIVVGAEVDGVAVGDTVGVQPFRGLLPG